MAQTQTHPAWCDRDGCEERGHQSTPIVAGHDTDLYPVDVALAAVDRGDGRLVSFVVLGVTEDDVRRSWPLTTTQAVQLAAALTAWLRV